MDLLSEKLDVQSAKADQRMDEMRTSQDEMQASQDEMRTSQDEMRASQDEMRREMEELQDEMRREMEELHAQNQLLLSKISALSSQNSNAPGIFDGADRRKREADGKNGPAAGVGQRQLAFFDMYVISLKSSLTTFSFPMAFTCRDYPMVGRSAYDYLCCSGNMYC